MKKIILFSAILCMGVASCSTDDITDGRNSVVNTEPIAGFTPEGSTQFATVAGDTATPNAARQLLVNMTYTRKGKGVFTWAESDKLWLEQSPGVFVKSTAIDIKDQAQNATFTYAGTYTNPTYNMRYTGKDATSASQVNISNVQRQSAAGSSAHFEVSGDCGFATATKSAEGCYDFTLEHAATYLALYPHVYDVYVSPKVLSVEITEMTGKPIAGLFHFDQAGIGAVISGASNKITVELDTSFVLTNRFQNDKAIYAIIKPGDYELQVSYLLEYPDGEKSQINHRMTTTPHRFLPNRVYDLRSYMTWETADFARWGATYRDGGYHDTEVDLESTGPRSGNPADFLNVWVTSRTSSNLPRYEYPTYITAMWLLNGNAENNLPIYFDPDKEWENFSKRKRKGGLWIGRMRNYGFSEENYIQPNALPTGDLKKEQSVIVGTPADTAKYFFLPAYGRLETSDNYTRVLEQETDGYYWLSTGDRDNNPTNAFLLHFNKDKVEVISRPRISQYVPLHYYQIR